MNRNHRPHWRAKHRSPL